MWQYVPMPRILQIEGLYTAFSQHRMPGYVFRGETHDFAELVIVASGRIGVTAGMDSFPLEAGCAILHPAMEFHSLRTDGEEPCEIIIFSFGASKLPEFPSRIFTVSGENMERARHILCLLQETTAKMGATAAEILQGKESGAQCAVLELEQLILTLAPRDKKALPGENSAGIRNYRHALRVMSENLHRPLDTAQLAALCHISPSLLKKLFSHYAGIGVMEYFRGRKINAAIPYLRDGESVAAVAERFGFGDPGYFSTVFRRVTGKSPTEYRHR